MMRTNDSIENLFTTHQVFNSRWLMPLTLLLYGQTSYIKREREKLYVCVFVCLFASKLIWDNLHNFIHEFISSSKQQQKYHHHHHQWIVLRCPFLYMVDVPIFSCLFFHILWINTGRDYVLFGPTVLYRKGDAAAAVAAIDAVCFCWFFIFRVLEMCGIYIPFVVFFLLVSCSFVHSMKRGGGQQFS